MAKRTQPKSKSKPKPPKRQPRAQALPGLEDHAIRALDTAATEYAEIRDQRMELTRQESPLKDRLLKLMKKHGREKYRHNGVTIEVVTTEETVRVKIAKPGDELDDADPDAPGEPPEDEGTENLDGETLADA